MKCQHCRAELKVPPQDEWILTFMGDDADGAWLVFESQCPKCKRLAIYIVHGDLAVNIAPRKGDQLKLSEALAIVKEISPVSGT